MATEVIMPKTGMSQETGTVVRWYYKEGEAVKEGEPLLEVMTDKVNMDVEAPASGILKGIKANPNDVVPVAQVIAYITEPGEELAVKAEPKAVAAAAQAPAAAPKPAAEAPVAVKAAGPAAGRVAATPVARKIAKEKGLELGQVAGTGPGGVITKADVLQATERAVPAVAAQAPAVSVAASAMTAQAPALSPVAAGAKSIQLVGRRRIIANRMQQSFQQAPHIALTIEVDMTAAEEARHGASFTALLVHVVSRVLRKHPLVNSTLNGDQIALLDQINVGVAADTPDGLIVPVVKGADTKLLDDIDTQVKDLAKRARAGKLTVDEVTGGTFTITNLGMFGIPQFRAIINPPEAAILAVGSIVKRPVVIDDGIHIRPMMVMTCSADHRILDGVSVAKFLQDIKTALETIS